MSFKDIPFGNIEEFNVVVEISHGSRNKMEWDPKTDAMHVDFVFSEHFAWPYNYGFVPQSLGGDGDALDAVVLSVTPMPPGTVVKVRAVGMVELKDRGEVDNKLLTVPVDDDTQAYIQNVQDLPAEYVQNLERLFADLAREKNKVIEVLGFRDKARAIHEIKKSLLS